MRSRMGGKAKPYPMCSDSFQAAPMPQIARPFVMTSSVVTILPTSAGFRYVTPVTSVARRTRLVSRASAASVM